MSSVYGRKRTRNGHRVSVPADQWLWSPEPVHPAIVDRATWDEAQNISAGHGTSRDGDEPNSHPATLRSYAYRSRVRCRDCRRRMAGRTTTGPRAQFTYYKCPLKAIPGILNPGQDGYHDTDLEAGEPALVGDLFNTPICGSM